MKINKLVAASILGILFDFSAVDAMNPYLSHYSALTSNNHAQLSAGNTPVYSGTLLELIVPKLDQISDICKLIDDLILEINGAAQIAGVQAKDQHPYFSDKKYECIFQLSEEINKLRQARNIISPPKYNDSSIGVVREAYAEKIIKLIDQKFVDLNNLVKREIDEILAPLQSGEELSSINTVKVCELLVQLESSSVPKFARYATKKDKSFHFSKDLGGRWELIPCPDPNPSYYIRHDFLENFGLRVFAGHDGKLHKK